MLLTKPSYFKTKISLKKEILSIIFVRIHDANFIKNDFTIKSMVRHLTMNDNELAILKKKTHE